jgi:adenylate cyclase
VELDTDGTVAAWKSARDNVIKPLVDKKSGHIIKFTGDGFLVEFPSVQDAVACAITLQVELRSSFLNFRIGINVGDITDDGGDVHGEGVNIAARLEALAEPGGICISGDVYNQVRNRIDAVFKDMGEQEVKHVSRPVSVYAINPPEQKMSDHITPPTSALPDKPSIAVLPFDNMSGDPEQEYFSDGITEDIITELSRFRSLFVIARNSSFAFKGQAIDITEIGKKLGVKFVVEGSVRKAGDRIRITAQLIETSTGNHLWAERYDRDLTDIFAVQDEVAAQIVTMVPGHVDIANRVQAERKPAQDMIYCSVQSTK